MWKRNDGGTSDVSKKFGQDLLQKRSGMLYHPRTGQKVRSNQIVSKNAGPNIDRELHAVAYDEGSPKHVVAYDEGSMISRLKSHKLNPKFPRYLLVYSLQ